MSPGALPRLLVITDWELPRDRLLGAVAALAPLGPRIGLQHRAPGMDARRFLAEARELSSLLGPHRVPLFVNGRLDVALLVGAHLHLPTGGLAVDEARRHLGPDRWISVALHDGEEARAEGASLALVSPVFPPGSKPRDRRPTLGPAGLRRVAARVACPAFALGGVDEARVPALAGVAGIAVVSAVLRAPDPRQAAERLLALLESGGGPPG